VNFNGIGIAQSAVWDWRFDNTFNGYVAVLFPEVAAATRRATLGDGDRDGAQLGLLTMQMGVRMCSANVYFSY
jgi:hypothetical protein